MNIEEELHGKQILACIPVWATADFPGFDPQTQSTSYSKYIKRRCHLCPVLCWVGERGQALVNAGIAAIICPQCLVRYAKRLGIDPKDLQMQTLTKKD